MVLADQGRHAVEGTGHSGVFSCEKRHHRHPPQKGISQPFQYHSTRLILRWQARLLGQLSRLAAHEVIVGVDGHEIRHLLVLLLLLNLLSLHRQSMAHLAKQLLDVLLVAWHTPGWVCLRHFLIKYSFVD